MRFRSPYFALAILTALNSINYIDRSILFQVQPLIQREFGVSKTQIGLLTTAFTIALVMALPLWGRAADRYSRRVIMAAGGIAWSLATLLTGVTWDFQSLLIRHAMVAVAEASMVAAPAHIADLFPQDKRTRMLAFLYIAGPTGNALGYVLAGVLGHLYGWRAPFYVVSGPGVLIALLLLATREPARGTNDNAVTSTDPDSLRGLFRNRAYLTATLGLALITFAIAGAAVWMPDFLANERNMNLLTAGAFIGAITVINGIGATLGGGWLADRIRRRRPDANYLVPGISAALAVPAFAAAVYLPAPAMFVAIFIAECCLLITYAPLGAATIQSVGPRIRSTAFAFHAMTIRLLGDAFAPLVIGHIADQPGGSLQIGFLVAIAAVALGAVILFNGRQYATRLPIGEGRAAAVGN